MIYTQDLLKLIVKIINLFEGTDFKLVQGDNYQLIELDALIEFQFERLEFINFAETNFYLYNVIENYPYVKGLIIILQSLYNRLNRKYHIYPEDEEMFINMVYSYKMKLEENEIEKPKIKENALHLLLRKIKKIIFKR